MEFRDFLMFLRRWAWFLGLAVVICGGVAFVVSKSLPDVYQANAKVLIQQAPSQYGNQYNDILAAERLSKTYGELLTTRPVLEQAIQKLGMQITPEDLAKKIDVQLPRDTQIIQVNVQDTGPQKASSIANATADAFVAQVQDLQARAFSGPKERLMAQVDQAKDEVDSATQELAAARDRGDSLDVIQRLQEQLTLQRQSYSGLLTSYQTMEQEEAQASSSVRVVEPAIDPATPVGPRVMLNTLVGVLLGLLVAAAISVGVDYLDDTVKGAQDLSAMGIPLLGSIMRFRSSKGQSLPELVRDHPTSTLAEGYRALRTNLQFASLDTKLGSLLVTSSHPSEGKTTTACNLCIVMAQSGKRVVLVDTDLRRPSVHRQFGLPAEPGLTNLLLEENIDPATALRPTTVERLKVIPSGPIPPNPADLLGSARMDALMRYLSTQADVVVFDSPPVLAVTDPAVIASKVDGVLLVAQHGSTRRETLRQSVEAMKTAGGRVLGVAVNKLAGSRGRSYYYYDYNRYGYTADKGKSGRGSSGKGEAKKALSAPHMPKI